MATYNISLADLRQDIAGVVPADLILSWNGTARTAAQQAQLLAPYRIRGTIVSTDSAGLSKLTQRYTLAQVMKLVSEPKELIHSYGTAIGGQAIGIWAADNSQMFFPEKIDPSRVLAQMLAAQAKVKPLQVQVGMGLHSCECYSVGGGLFGEGAEFIEAIAEDQTSGGEIVFTKEIFERLAGSVRAAARPREDLRQHGELWSLTSFSGAVEAMEGGNPDYPTPFDAAFFQRMRAASVEALGQEEFPEYRKTQTVAFVKVKHRPHGLLMDSFTDMSLSNLAVRRIAASHGADVVKSNGSLAIVLFTEGKAAVSFARDVIEENHRLGFQAHVGLTHGEVYLFPLANGEREIAGNPVNIASKLSEDSGLEGVLVEDSVQLGALAQQGEPFRLTLSKVELSGRRFPV
jgi:class 3 adenylate cyclase